MNIEMVRSLVKQCYSGVDWARKVDKMTDKQVMAIYLRLKREGRLP